MADEVKKPNTHDVSYSASFSPELAPTITVTDAEPVAGATPAPTGLEPGLNAEISGSYSYFTPLYDSFWGLKYTADATIKPSLKFADWSKVAAPVEISTGISVLKYWQQSVIFESESKEKGSLKFGTGYDYTTDVNTKYHLGLNFPVELVPGSGESNNMELAATWKGPLNGFLTFIPETDAYFDMSLKLVMPSLIDSTDNYYFDGDKKFFEALGSAPLTPTFKGAVTFLSPIQLPVFGAKMYAQPFGEYAPPSTDTATGTTTTKYKLGGQFIWAESAEKAGTKKYAGYFPHYLKYTYNNESTDTVKNAATGYTWSTADNEGNPASSTRTEAGTEKHEFGLGFGVPETRFGKDKSIAVNPTIDLSAGWTPAGESTVWGVSSDGYDRVIDKPGTDETWTIKFGITTTFTKAEDK